MTHAQKPNGKSAIFKAKLPERKAKQFHFKGLQQVSYRSIRLIN